MSYFKFEMHQNSISDGGAYSAPTDPLAWFEGTYF